MIYVDMDGPICDLLSVWLDEYNGLFDDSLTPADIHGWDMREYVKPHARKHIAEILEYSHLYDNVLPTEGALDALDKLGTPGVDWMIASHCSSTVQLDGKVRWLRRHGLAARTGFPNYFIPIYHKHLLRGSALIDDGTHNLVDFKGIQVLWDEPHKRSVTRFTRAMNWEHALDVLRHHHILPILT